MAFTVSDFRRELKTGPYAWPGGYPRFFLLSDGEALSFKDAKANARLVMEAIRDRDNSGWRVVGVDVNWEDDNLFSAHSGEKIESAYGDNPAKRTKRTSRGRSKGGLKRPSQSTGEAPSSRLLKRRRKTAAAPRGFFANPAKVRILRDTHFAAGALFRVYEKRRTVNLGVVSDWNPIATFDDLSKAKDYAKAYADANNRQVVIAGNFAGVSEFKNKRVAR